MIQLTYSGDEQQIINERKESLQQTHANLYCLLYTSELPTICSV